MIGGVVLSYCRPVPAPMLSLASLPAGLFTAWKRARQRIYRYDGSGDSWADAICKLMDPR